MRNSRGFFRDAESLVCVQRQEQYGDPAEDFSRIADLWTIHVGQRLRLDASDVAIMMILLKTARLMHNPQHRDTWLDIAGYAACGAQIACKSTDEETIDAPTTAD